MRTKPVFTLTQKEDVNFYVERKASYAFYDADVWEIVLPISGKTELSAEGKKHILERGKIAFITPSIKRRLTLRTTGGEYISVRVKPAFVEKLFGEFDPQSYEIFKSLDIYFRPIDELHVSGVVDAVNDIHVAEEVYKNMYLKKLGYTLLIGLVPFRTYNGNGDVVSRALTAMSDAKNVSARLPEIASQVGCSEEYLVRCFKKAGLETPNTIFKRIKLRYAKSLLTTMKVSVQEVSTLIGFKSVGHFNKLYCNEYGVNPGVDKNR